MTRLGQLVLFIGTCLFASAKLYAQPAPSWAKSIYDRATNIENTQNPNSSPQTTSNPSSSSSTTSAPLPYAPASSIGAGSPQTSNSISKSELGENNRKAYTFTLGLVMSGDSTRSELADRRDMLGTTLNIGAKYVFSDWAYVEANPSLKFLSGHTQSASATNDRDKNVLLQSTQFVFSDANYFSASAGIQDLTKDHSSILINNPMASARVMVSSGEKNKTAASLFSYAGVPGSSSDSNNSNDLDKTPSFGSTGLRLRYKDDLFESHIQVSMFQYRDLSSAVATDSYLLGNSTTAETSMTSVRQFDYEFQGVEAIAEIDWQFHPLFKWNINASAIQNREAPEGLNSGYAIVNTLEIGVGSKWKVIPSYTYYRIEPDATVANFNDEKMNTNRVGYLGGLSFQYKNEFKFGGVAGERDVVYTSAVQGKETYVGITLEALSVSF